MDGPYTIYRVTGPDGRMYTGYTSMSVKDRWRCHVTKAKLGEAIGHPFYEAIRLYDSSLFTVEVLETAFDLHHALHLEKKWIAECPVEKRYNLSPGGLDDARFGARRFWKRLDENPEERAAYLKKLSDIKKADDWTDYADLSEKSAQWRKEHPREAYKMAYRAIRLANRKNMELGLRPAPAPPIPETQEEMKHRLMWKFRRAEAIRRNTTAQWAGLSEKERQKVSESISKAHKERAATMTAAEKRIMTEKARAAIDRSKQGLAASQGLKRYWEELKKDPERYKELMERRKATWRNTMERKRNENI